MSRKEEIMDYLRAQGFRPELDEDGDIRVKYQMLNFIIFDNSSDENYLQIALPFIYEASDDKLIDALLACNEVSKGRKVIKGVMINNNAWLFFEVLIDKNPDYDDIIPRGLEMLVGGRQFFYDQINK
jgi:hypothetical protein